jgi:transcription elongation factor SPT6
VPSEITSQSSELLAVALHPMQAECAPHLLLAAAERALVESAAAAGVDLGACLLRPHLAAPLQFVPGLGPRKAQSLLRALRQQKVTSRRMLAAPRGDALPPLLGPCVFRNAAGFLRIGPRSLTFGAPDGLYAVGKGGRASLAALLPSPADASGRPEPPDTAGTRRR